MSNYANPSAVVGPEWLAENLARPDVRVIEMDTDPIEYDQGHIEGAVFWPALSLLDDGMATLADADAIEALVGGAGITKDTTLVFVHGRYRATSGWLYWFFRRLGHSKMHVLNGGREKWTNEGFPLNTGPTPKTRASYPVSDLTHENTAFLTDIKEAIGAENKVILDVRTPPEFAGDVYLQGPTEPGQIAGHIPGAQHLYYEDVHEADGTFRSVEELLTLFSNVGVTAQKTVFPYCAIGGRSGHIWFVLNQLLGFSSVRNYDGSWREWSTISGLPVEI